MKNRKLKIRVIEDDNYFLIYLPSTLLRERVKSIPNRKYNSRERFWYFDKNTENFDNISREFLKDSLTFDITRPASKKEHKEQPANDSAGKVEENSLKDNYSLVQDELTNIKAEIESFKQVDLEQTKTIELVSKQLTEQFSRIEKFNLKEKSSNVIEETTLIDLFSWGVDTNKKNLFAHLGFKLNFNDTTGVLNILHQKLEENLFLLLDIPKSLRIKYDLFKLIEEATDLGVIEKFDASNFHNFRQYRNLCGHGSRGKKRIILSQSKMKVAAAAAILSLSLSWDASIRKK